MRVRALIRTLSPDTVFSFTSERFIASFSEHLGGSASFRRRRRPAPGLSRAVARLLSPRARQAFSRTVTLVGSGIFLTMGLQAFNRRRPPFLQWPERAFAAFSCVTLGALIMVIRTSSSLSCSPGWIHPPHHRKRRYEVEHAHRFESMNRPARSTDRSPQSEAQGRWANALNHYRRRLQASRAPQRHTRFRPGLFANEPLGPRGGSVIVWAGMRGAITLRRANNLARSRCALCCSPIALFIAAEPRHPGPDACRG